MAAGHVAVQILFKVVLPDCGTVDPYGCRIGLCDSCNRGVSRRDDYLDRTARHLGDAARNFQGSNVRSLITISLLGS